MKYNTLFAVILAAVLLLSLTACGTTQSLATSENMGSTTQQTEQRSDEETSTTEAAPTGAEEVSEEEPWKTALAEELFEKYGVSQAMFISPIVNMERLIADMMMWANVTEAELESKKEIPTEFGETLSWEYLCYVRKHPIEWSIPTCILYGGKDHLTNRETVSEFAHRIGADLTVMEDGEHWFHTAEQMKVLDHWISNSTR